MMLMGYFPKYCVYFVNASAFFFQIRPTQFHKKIYTPTKRYETQYRERGAVFVSDVAEDKPRFSHEFEYLK